MKVFKVGIVAILLFQLGCGAMPTSSTFQNVEVAKVEKSKYKTCTISFGEFRWGEERMKTEIVPANDAALFANSLKALEESHLCENVVLKDLLFKRVDGLLKDDVLQSYLEDNFEKSDDFKITFYRIGGRNNAMGSPESFVTSLMIVPYIITIGLFPLWAPWSQDMLVAVQKPDSKKIEFQNLHNSYSLWLWTPFLFFPSGERGYWDANKRTQRVDRESVITGVNSVAKP